MNSKPASLSDDEIDEAILFLARERAKIKFQLIEETESDLSEDEKRGKEWELKAQKALIIIGHKQHKLILEQTRRIKIKKELNKTKNIQESQRKNQSDAERFVDCARVVLTKDQYLSIWHLANQSRGLPNA